MTRQHKTKLIIAAIAALAAEVISPMLSNTASAASPPQFTQAFLRLDRLMTGVATGGTACVKPTTVATEASFEITFPTQTITDFALDPTAGNWTVSTASNLLPSTATAWPGIGTATSVSGHTVTFPSGDLTVGTLYCFHFAAMLTNGASGASLQGLMHTRTSVPAIIDETNYAVAIVANDQITVSAVVPPTFVFSLSGNTDNFGGNLDPTAGATGIKSTTGRTVSVTTNAKGGWIGWVKDSQQGLFSATAAYTIATSGTVNGAPSTINGGVEGYVLDADMTTDASGGCVVAIDPEYDGTGTNQGGTLSVDFQPVVACTGAAPATSNGDVITLIERATIAGGTPAGSDYSDIITVVAAGNF